MDELTEKINSILNDPQSLEQIKGLAGMLGGSMPSTEAGNPQPPATAAADPFSMLQLAPLLNVFKAEDDTTRFLCSLRPLLSAERQKKLDEALKILRLIKLFPLIKNSGILSSLF